MSATLAAQWETVPGNPERVMLWNLSASAYFAPKDDRAVALPLHRCQVRATFEGSELTLDFDGVGTIRCAIAEANQDRWRTRRAANSSNGPPRPGAPGASYVETS